MQTNYKFKTNPTTLQENMVVGEKYRISVLTPGLIRLEYCEEGDFEDRATQVVCNRDFPRTDFQRMENAEGLEIVTERLRLRYDKGEFSPRGLEFEIFGSTIPGGGNHWRYGQPIEDLGGTARTLDGVDGACPLGHGLVSVWGYSVLDDSESLILTEEGWVAPRKKGGKDLYFWGYGLDYLECLKDFYHLCGKTPMLPRYALGNWWSRYYTYTEESYLELMHRFDQEGIPFSVAVIDMDWHLTHIDPKYGSGWTGYTWDRELFPDPKRFMDALHERGMKVTLNVHPADGIQAHEEMYEAMALELGKDISKEEPIAFEITDPAFLEAYFKYAHHPNEEQGVDFWWIDWQQGNVTKVEGLDPLWMLNHFHFLDSARDGKRPMTFSRYAGPGSHRYPVGFSGDSVVTWESLQFQPYFTSTASNIGYGWWSHDIGGHMNGYRDDELEGRWYQLGVFSPINRLHSTKNEFMGKEPWKFKSEIHQMMVDFLQLRYKLLPYLYTMNYRAYQEDIPLVLPVYYLKPTAWDSYRVKNEYCFGSEMIVMPITSPRVPKLNRAKEKVWLPEGTFYDFFSGMRYEGDRTMWMYRDIDTLPVLVRAGAIIPMQENMDMQSPEQLTLRIYLGADHTFVLYEDDNESCDYENGICALTTIRQDWQDQQIIVESVKGERALLPAKRDYVVELYGCKENTILCEINGERISCASTYDEERHCLKTELSQIDTADEIRLTFGMKAELAANDVNRLAYEFLNQAEIDYNTKSAIYRTICRETKAARVLSQLQAMDLSEDMVACLTEILTAVN